MKTLKERKIMKTLIKRRIMTTLKERKIMITLKERVIMTTLQDQLARSKINENFENCLEEKKYKCEEDYLTRRKLCVRSLELKGNNLYSSLE